MGRGASSCTAVSQGFDLADARVMIAGAIEELAELLLEEGKPLPVPGPDTTFSDADLVELIPLSVHAGTVLRLYASAPQ